MTDDKDRHDFKNQLAVILGFSEILLAEATANDPRRGDFEEIHKAATAALDLLERLFPIDAERSNDGCLQMPVRLRKPRQRTEPFRRNKIASASVRLFSTRCLGPRVTQGSIGRGLAPSDLAHKRAIHGSTGPGVEVTHGACLS